MSKPKVAFYWCASCGGCEETVVDLAEDILGVVEKIDIVLWPVAMDFKYKDLRALADQSLFATLLNGAIRSQEQEEMARLLRRKSRFLIAYGSCAHTGGIPGLANQFPREQILQFNYETSPSVVNPAKTRPQTRLDDQGRVVTLPALHQVVRALDQVVEVDYYVPGCPPTPKSPRRPWAPSWPATCPPRARCWPPTSPCVTSAPARPPNPPTSPSPPSTGPTECCSTRRNVFSPREWSAWARPRGRVARPSAPPATCLAPAVSAPPPGCATRGRRSCPRFVPTSLARKRKTSARPSTPSPTRGHFLSLLGLPKAFSAANQPVCQRLTQSTPI